MKLVSVAQKPGEEKEEKAELAAESKQPIYPYGLCITLNEETIEKLGLKDLPKVGSKGTIQAKVTVTMTRATEGQAHSSMGIDLQITDLGLELKGGEKSAVDTFYPDGGKTGLRGKSE